MTQYRATTFWLGVVTVGLAALTLMLFITRGQVGDANTRIAGVSAQARSLAASAALLSAQTEQVITTGRQQRLATTAAICKQTNELTGKLKRLIIASVVSSRRFERTFRRLHLPPYRARLRQAMREARSLDLVDCRPLRTQNPGG